MSQTAAAPAAVAEFDAILDAEQAVRTDQALAAMGSDLDTRVRAEGRLPQSKARMFALVDALGSGPRLGAFIAYRRAVRQAQGLPVAQD